MLMTMDPERVRAYLQVACAGLGFDIGEVWWTSIENGPSNLATIGNSSYDDDELSDGPKSDSEQRLALRKNKKLRFVQLYTSGSYENRRADLVNPPDESYSSSGSRQSGSSDNLQKHALSPRLVDAISETMQVVWATTKKREGLIGRSDVRLQTAVGMPVAMDNQGNMCVVVMFSPENIQSTDDAMEYLYSISQSASSSSIPCLLPVFDGLRGGVKRIEAPTDYSHQTLVPHPDPNSLGEGVSARFVSLDDQNLFRTSVGTKALSDDVEVHSDHDLSAAPKDTFGIPMLPSFAEIGGQVTPESVESEDAFDEATYGIWTTVMESTHFENEFENSFHALESLFTDAKPASFDFVSQEEADYSLLMNSYSAFPTPFPMKESRRERLVEFLIAFLGMSVFDMADVWVPSGADSPYPADTLRHVVTVSSKSSINNPMLNIFRNVSERTLIKFWNGAVGRAFSTGNPVWSSNESSFMDRGRVGAFQQAQFHTVLAVPVFSKSGLQPTCVVATYAFVKSGSVPFVLRFVQQALRLLWDGLDRIDQPHVPGDVWQHVAPADLGEMAADLEMQEHFLAKKRTHQTMMVPNDVMPLPSEDDPETGNISSQLQSIELPNGDVVSIPLHLQDTDPIPLESMPPEPISIYIDDLHDHFQDDGRSGALAVNSKQPFEIPMTFIPVHVNTNSSGSKRAHVGVSSGVRLSALAMPFALPSKIVNSNRSSGGSSGFGGYSVDKNQTAMSANPGFVGSKALPASLPNSQPSFVGFGMIPVAFSFQGNTPSGSTNTMQFPSNDIPSNSSNNMMHFTLSERPSGPPSNRVQFQPSNVIQNTPPVMGAEAELCPSTEFCLPVNNKPVSDGVNRVTSGKLCRIQGCSDVALAKRPYCVKHSGNRQCEHPDCNKCAQGSTRFCIAHGGGRRCTFPGCDKGARDKFYCAAHGGGKRCQYEGGCTKSAVGGSHLCTAHGGGKRCDVPGCGKSAQSSTRFCVKHGGGKKCCFDGCEKVARGRTMYCAAHGGGVRCKLDGCTRVAIGKLQLCRAHGGGSSRGANGEDSPEFSPRMTSSVSSDEVDDDVFCGPLDSLENFGL